MKKDMKKDMEETKDLLLMNRVVQALLNEELSSLELKIFAILQSLAGARCSVDIRSLAVLFEISREDFNGTCNNNAGLSCSNKVRNTPLSPAIPARKELLEKEKGIRAEAAQKASEDFNTKIREQEETINRLRNNSLRTCEADYRKPKSLRRNN